MNSSSKYYWRILVILVGGNHCFREAGGGKVVGGGRILEALCLRSWMNWNIISNCRRTRQIRMNSLSISNI